MNQMGKFFIQFYVICITSAAYSNTAAILATPGGDPNTGGWYVKEFGPLDSNYSMGDFARYTVTEGSNTPVNPLPQFKGNGLNIYYGIADIPYALDIYQYGDNSFNLYNFVGYLFAGYAALNINPSSLTKTNWLTTFRQSGQWQTGSLAFDNNPKAAYTIQLVDFVKRKINFAAASSLGWSTGSLDTGQFLLNASFPFVNTEPLSYWLDKANASCAWTAHSAKGNYVLAIMSSNSDIKGYAAPYGQMFGARLAHILGAVVNDVPKVSNVVTMMPSNPNSPVPQLAIMNGGPYATAAVAPAGITTPSTAHFGSMQNYITDLAANIAPGLKNSTAYAYLQNHILPTVTRLATLCSYAISSSSTPSQNNLIQINSENVTAYDNGVILAIQNNTGDALEVQQVTSAGKNLIGKLKRGMNHHFLHTASLMNGVTATTAGTSAEPLPVNFIEIQNLAAKANAYIQVLNGDQLPALVAALNESLTTISGSSDYSFAYNQGNTYTQPNDAEYLVILNFNPTTIATTTSQIQEILMYRIQAINLSEFKGKPYVATLQIDSSIAGNGLSNNQLVQNSAGTTILYPSFVSIKTFSWQNPYDKTRGSNFYSSMPLLLIPDYVMSSGISGLAAHYGIWLMSYAAALTEFQFGCEFGNTIDCLRNVFNLFDHASSQDASARVVIDAGGNLNSGQILETKFCKIMGSDVWDFGNDFHQDIPILNLYQNGNNVIANQKNGDFVNFAISFDSRENLNLKDKKSIAQDSQSILFADHDQAPYANTMLFSILASDLQAGIVAMLSQPTAGNYRLELQDNSGNVLAVQKIAISKVEKNPKISFKFLDDTMLNSQTIIPQSIVDQVKAEKSVTFRVKFSAKGNNFLIEKMMKAKL